MNQKTLDNYFKFRGYQTPDLEDSLLFFLTEVAELSRAIRATIGDALSDNTLNILADMEEVGLEAENVVSGRDNWVRNGDRHKEENVGDEIADCLMMLSRVASSGGFRSPDELLLEKMAKKGFYPRGNKKSS